MYENVAKELRNLLRAYKATDNGNCHQAKIIAKAADVIEQFSSAGSIYGKAWTLGYDAGRDENMPHWIPVTERLPDNIDEEVLVCNEDYGKSGLGFVTVAIYDGSGWLECWERETYLTAITHWMPIPEPPKEET